MIPTLRLGNETNRQRAEALLRKLRLDPRDLIGAGSEDDEAVRRILVDVAERGDDAVVETSRRFDDPNFTAAQIRVTEQEMRDAGSRVTPQQMAALRQSIE